MPPTYSARNTTPAHVAAETTASDIDEERAAPAIRTTSTAISQNVPTAQVRPSPTNPRQTSDQEALDALTASIAEHGILEPLIVLRRPDSTTTYELIAGERRWRAATAAGLTTVPARVMIVDSRQALELQALENLQRADLNAIEEAQTFRQLAEAGLTQSAIARTVGKSQPFVANRLRLLSLPDDVRTLVRDGTLTPAHGGSLARFSAFPAIASKMAAHTVKYSTTVKDLEKLEIPHVWELQKTGLAVQISAEKTGIFADCATACPFQAYRKETYSSWCLNPPHAAELRAVAQADFERQQATATETAAATDYPRINYTQHTDRSAYPPPGCSDACPCATQAISEASNGSLSLVPVCTDRARWDALREAGVNAATERRQHNHDAHLARALVPLAADASGSTRRLAIVVLAALVDVRLPFLEAASQQQTDGRATQTPRSPGHNTPEESAAHILANLNDLSRLDTGELIRYAADALIRKELHDRHLAHSRTTPLSDWLLGDSTP